MLPISITTNSNVSSGKKTYQLTPASYLKKKAFSKVDGAKTIASVVAVVNTVANPATIIVNAGAAMNAGIRNLHSAGVSAVSTTIFDTVANFYNSPLDYILFSMFADKNGAYALPPILESCVKSWAESANAAAEAAKSATETATSVADVANVLGAVSVALQVPQVIVKSTKVGLGIKKAAEIKKDRWKLYGLQDGSASN